MNNKLKGMVRRVEAATSQDVRFFANPSIASLVRRYGFDIIETPTLDRDRIIAMPIDDIKPIKFIWEN